ncbi:MAG: 3-phosphoshikimate 1-carboxyvinyltransferase [Dethiobacter sp.]|jgi:3-phosphoshikimate 1-carboxyvinyltransferase|nr:3-phosphoshikimate 1-carboxyvinyltransferase [Dethiobacter sp.]MBS3897211.1 3-phosphoshikimate 1-carboxyvinyltransferase [Dethiobacter sp.]MBS3982465.1 3-phosphoshikimate 1-carboxyvinyltransferase [Dethiobacter sp.]MCL4462547.1 3-phosphoshikimate 1-carboxyvinyltransferase [Bacillota bacterium]MCL5993175.1 3-phosphoshikimate 1-carboxyvinyltransferase [Bacillota bacterium]
MKVVIEGSGPIRGEITVPGDKSISHRALILGALAEGETVISGFLAGEDCLSTADCLRKLGVSIAVQASNVQVAGVGLYGLREPATILDCGNSGTTARLLLGILAGQPFYSVLTGDGSLRQRPMSRVVEPLRRMGAAIWGRNQGKLLPLSVQGGVMRALEYVSPLASAQVKSAVLLAGLYAQGITAVREPEKSRDHSERMLAAFGATIEVEGNLVRLQGQPKLQGQAVRVPGDISSAAFFLVAASIIPGSDLIVRNVGVNPTRTGVLDVLREMGAALELLNERLESGEPVADIRVQSADLRGVEIGGEIIPRLIDELPILAVAAMFAAGETYVRDAAELRVKETDRIAAVAEEFGKLGAAITPLADGFVVSGGRQLSAAITDSRGDHRIAMALCIAALAGKVRLTMDSADCVVISFPGFWQALRQGQIECLDFLE